jgi:hypothetical protein
MMGVANEVASRAMAKAELYVVAIDPRVNVVGAEPRLAAVDVGRTARPLLKADQAGICGFPDSFIVSTATRRILAISSRSSLDHNS